VTDATAHQAADLIGIEHLVDVVAVPVMG